MTAIIKNITEKLELNKNNLPSFKFFCEATIVGGIIVGSMFGYEYSMVGLLLGMASSFLVSGE